MTIRLPVGQIGLVLMVLALAACRQAEPPAPSEPPATAQSQAAAACELNVGWDPWEPYHYLAAGGELQGLDVEIVRLLADEAGCELEFLQGSWEGLLRLLRAGEVDVMMGATRIPAREAYAIFSEPYRTEAFRLYVLDDDVERYRDRSLGDLLSDGFRLGVTQGYFYGDEVGEVLERAEFQDRIVEAAVGELNFARLLDGRIDGFIEDPFVAAAIARRAAYPDRINALSPLLGSGPVNFMFSRASVDPAIVERFDRALAGLRESGRHAELLDEYLE